METERSRSVMWQPTNGIGLEVCSFGIAKESDRYGKITEGFGIDGLVIGVSENKAFEIRYGLFCDPQGKHQSAYFDYRINDKRNYTSKPYSTDGDGSWRDHYGREEQKFDGCLTVYLLQTPATVTLALMRLNLQPKQTQQIKVMHIDTLAVRFTPEIYTYTCLERTQLGGTYIHENLSSGIKTKFTADADNLVIDYEGQFRRVWTNTE